MSADIRPARASDIDALLAIEDAVFEGDRLSRRSFIRHLDSETALLLVAEEAGEVAGYALLFHRRSDRIVRIYSLAVAPKFMSRGVGKRLLAAAEREASAMNRSVLSLEVREDNERALQLYEGAGYLQMKRLPAYYEDGAGALRLNKVVGAKP
jgi:ribosomal protein S18 acetylase RimI-like enzyme